MSRNTSYLRRAAAAVVAGTVALATVALTAPPAAAAALNASAQAGTSFNTSGGATCATVGSGGATPVVPLVSGAPPVVFTRSDTSVATDSGDTSDVTNMSASLAVTAGATETAGSLRSFDMTAKMSATVSAAQGSATSCESSASSQATVIGTVTITSPSILDLTSSLHGGANGNVTLFLTANAAGPPTQLIEINFGNQGKSRRVVVLRPDTYTLNIVSSVQATEPDGLPSDVTSSTVDIGIHGLVSAPGTAETPQKGTGSRYLTVPGGLDCAGHAVTADFTKAAGKKPKKGEKPKLSKATFYVNGSKVKSVKKPHKNTEVKLSGLPDTDEVLVEALIKVRGKGAVTISRMYLPCS